MLYSFLRFRPKRKETDLPFEVRPYLRLSGDDPVEAIVKSVSGFRDALLYCLRSAWVSTVGWWNKRRGDQPWS
jgi:hypothetical protein